MKKLFLILSLTLFQGCLSTIGHYKEFTGDNGIDSVYEGTRSVWNEAICVWWLDESRFQSQRIIDSYTKLTYPFWIIDFPCEFVFDTVFFPYDIIKVSITDEKKEEENNDEERIIGKIHL